jgi:hypothetical protein
MPKIIHPLVIFLLLPSFMTANSFSALFPSAIAAGDTDQRMERDLFQRQAIVPEIINVGRELLVNNPIRRWGVTIRYSFSLYMYRRFVSIPYKKLPIEVLNNLRNSTVSDENKYLMVRSLSQLLDNNPLALRIYKDMLVVDPDVPFVIKREVMNLLCSGGNLRLSVLNTMNEQLNQPHIQKQLLSFYSTLFEKNFADKMNYWHLGAVTALCSLIRLDTPASMDIVENLLSTDSPHERRLILTVLFMHLSAIPLSIPPSVQFSAVSLRLTKKFVLD